MTTRSRTVSRKDFIFLSRDPCGYHLDAFTHPQGSRCALYCKRYRIDAPKRRSSSGRNPSLNCQHQDVYAPKMHKTQRILTVASDQLIASSFPAGTGGQCRICLGYSRRTREIESNVRKTYHGGTETRRNGKKL